MIIVKIVNGDACPVWACDECREIINLDRANLVFPAIYENGETITGRLLCHTCDSRERDSRNRKHTHWQHYRDTLRYAAINHRAIEEGDFF